MSVRLLSASVAMLLSELEIDANKAWDRWAITDCGGLSTVGAEKIADPGFDAPGSWTVTGTCVITGSEANFGTVAGSGTAAPNPALSVAVGSQYLLTYTVTGLRNASIQTSCGGVSGPSRFAAGTFSEVFTATSGANLVLTGTVVGGPKTACRIGDVSLKLLGDVEGSFLMKKAVLEGNFELSVDGASDIGTPTVGLGRAWLATDLTPGAPLPTFRGLACAASGGDFYVGNDNVFPGYYVQKTVQSGSTAVDNSTDYTNLYQGDAGYPRIAVNYALARTATPLNGMTIGDGATDPTGILWAGTKVETRFDDLNDKFVLHSSAGQCAFLEIGLDHATAQTAVRPRTDNKIDLGDSANALRWRRGYFVGRVDAGSFYVGGVAGHSGYIDDGANFRATFTGGILTSVGPSIAGGYA